MALYGNGANVNITTDATAGSYGITTAIPVITVSANKRISSINTASITVDASNNANASVGDLGTYAFLQQASSNTQYNPGATLAGSSLRYSDATGRVHANGPSGSWRCMGYDSGSALAVNSNAGSASASASGNISGTLQGGEVQGNANLSGEIAGNGSISGEVQGNTNTNGNLSIFAHGGSTKGSLSVGTNGLNVGGTAQINNVNVDGTANTSGLNVAGNVSGNASINVSVNSVSVNVTVSQSATLWLRYA